MIHGLRSRPRGAVQVLLFLMLLASACSCMGAEWPMYRGDVNRSGVADGLSSSVLRVAWKTKLSLSVDSSPSVANGRVYVGSDDGALSCLSAQDGELLWRVSTGGAIVSSPAIAHGVACVGSADRCVYGFAADSGDRLWCVQTRRPIVASPLILGGRAFIGSLDGSFRCLQVASGDVVWVHQGGPISASAASDGESLVYCGDEAGNLWARRVEDGKLVWQVELQGAVVRAAAVAGDVVVAGVMAPSALRAPRIGHVVAVDRASGRQVWAKQGQSSVLHSPIADAATVFYSAVSGYTSSTEMFAVGLRDGAERWKTRLGGVADSSPALAGDLLLFGLHDSHFHVVDSRDGRLVQRIPIGAKIFSSPAVVSDRVYFGASDGYLYCLEPENAALTGGPTLAAAESEL
jgi:outer membrane protein assembly factor BamB